MGETDGGDGADEAESERTLDVEVDGTKYLVHLKRRPFREGLEARVMIGGELVRIGELGFGEEALIERIRAELKRKMR